MPDGSARRGRSARLTRDGLLLVAGSVVVGLAGWLFGQPELTALAAMGLAATGGAWLWAQLRAVQVTVGRSVQSTRLRVGEEALVTLRLVNRGATRSPVFTVSDPAGGVGEVTLAVAPIPAGATRDLTYRFPARSRGVHLLGPATLTVDDPFSLASSTRRTVERQSVVVLPRTHPLARLGGTPGQTPTEGAAPLVSRSSTDDEFAALRPYAAGDDVRQVHWRSSARLGRLVVQQFDQPWQRRTTVVLDVRRAVHDDDSFERSVSAAASVVEQSANDGDLLRLVTTDGTDSGVVGPEAAEELLDGLAAVRVSGGGSLIATLGSLSDATGAGRLVVCTGGLETAAHRAVTEAVQDWDDRILLVSGPCAPAPVDHPPTLVEHRDDDLTGAWRRAVEAEQIRTGGAPR